MSEKKARATSTLRKSTAVGAIGALIGSTLALSAGVAQAAPSAPVAATPAAAVPPECGTADKGSQQGLDFECEWTTGFGKIHQFTVPKHVTSLEVTVKGGAGAATSGGPTVPGGTGAILSGTVPVKSGDTLNMIVGARASGKDKPGLGAAPGGKGGKPGWTGNASGAGGGSSEIVRPGAKPVVLVAAGGGGGGGSIGEPGSGFFGSCGSKFTGTGGKGGDAGRTLTGADGANGKTGGKGGKAGGSGSAAGANATALGNCSAPGGGGGGYPRGGAAGTAQSKNVNKNSDGGGGGGGDSYFDASVTKTSNTTGSTGNGSIKVSFTEPPLKITTTSVPDANYGKVYVTELKAVSSSTKPTKWTLTGGTLPAGLALTSTGIISGVPTNSTVGTSTYFFTVQADDGGSKQARTFAMDEIVKPAPGPTPSPGQPTANSTHSLVTDAPATNVRARGATGNGVVHPRGLAVTNIWCQISADNQDTILFPRVPAVPQRVAANAKDQPVTCKFTGLAPGTTYRYLVYARDASGIDDSFNPQVFTTSPKEAQTAKAVPPAHVARSGSTVLVKDGQKTNKGRLITVAIKRLGSTKRGAVRLVRSDRGGYRLITDGRPFKVEVTFTALGGKNFDAYYATHTYSRTRSPKVHRALGGPTLRKQDLGGGVRAWKRSKVSATLCGTLDGGATVDFSRGRSVRVHEDAMRYDTLKHAKQGYRKAVKCVKRSYGRIVSDPAIGDQSRIWSKNRGSERATVVREGKRVVVLEVSSVLKPYRVKSYSEGLAKVAIKRLR